MHTLDEYRRELRAATLHIYELQDEVSRLRMLVERLRKWRHAGASVPRPVPLNAEAKSTRRLSTDGTDDSTSD